MKSKELQYLINVCFLSVKRIILLNWKVRKQTDLMDLFAMECAASFLNNLEANHTDLLYLIK